MVVLYTGPCAAGYYCNLGSTVAQPIDGSTSISYSGDTCLSVKNATNGICPQAHYCPAGILYSRYSLIYSFLLNYREFCAYSMSYGYKFII